MLHDKKDSLLTEDVVQETACGLFSFRDMLEASVNATLIAKDGILIDMNSKCEHILGYSREELSGANLLDSVVLDQYHDEVAKRFTYTSDEYYLVKVLTKTKEIISVNLVTSSIGHKDSGYRMCSFRDIGMPFKNDEQNWLQQQDLSRSLQALFEQKRKFEKLFSISFNAYIIHKNGLMIEVNDVLSDLYGYSKEEIMKSDAFEFLFQDEAIIRKYKTDLEKQKRKHIVFKQRRKDGSFFEAELVAAEEIINGEVVRIVTIRDVSDLMSAQRALRKSKEMLDVKTMELDLIREEVLSSRVSFHQGLIGESSNLNPDMLVHAVLYGNFEFDLFSNSLILSDEVKDIFEMHETVSSLRDSDFLSLIDPIDALRLQENMEKSIFNRSLLKVEVAINISDTKRKYVLIQGIVQYADDNLPCRISGTVLDVTERKRIEDRLRKQNDHYLQLNEELIVARKKAEDSERLKTSFFSNMSHEIRTPMNGILGFSGLLLEKGLPEEERMEYAKVITDSGKRLLHIVNDVLDISKLESDTVRITKTNVDVNDLLVKLLRLFNKEQSVTSGDVVLKLFKGLDDNECVIKTDDIRLNQILFNLLSNALKFTKTGSVSFGCTQNEDMLRFYVKDTGIGIPDDMQEKVFEPFRQVEGHLVKQHGGTGLGLSISRKLAALLGGNLTLESKEGEGTTFSAFLPYDRAFPVKKEHKTLINALEDSSSTKTCLKLLLAEDDDVNYLFFKSFLKTRVTLIRAKTGIEAVEMVFSDPEIDIVLMDIKMPEMNGLDAIKKIRTEYPLLPIIVQTAYAMEGDRKTALDAGANDYVSKPINRRLLMKKIEDLCDS